MTTQDLAVSVRHCDEPDELYWHPAGALEPRGAHVELDLSDGVLLASYDEELTTAEGRGGVRRYWGIPVLTAEAANDLLDRLAPLAARVLSGALVDRDDNGNPVGRLTTDDAHDSESDIAALCEAEFADGEHNPGLLPVWGIEGATNGEEVEDYAITAKTTDAELDAITERHLTDFRDAMEQPHAVIHGMRDYLEGLRNDLR